MVSLAPCRHRRFLPSLRPPPVVTSGSFRHFDRLCRHRRFLPLLRPPLPSPTAPSVISAASAVTSGSFRHFDRLCRHQRLFPPLRLPPAVTSGSFRHFSRLLSAPTAFSVTDGSLSFRLPLLPSFRPEGTGGRNLSRCRQDTGKRKISRRFAPRNDGIMGTLRNDGMWVPLVMTEQGAFTMPSSIGRFSTLYEFIRGLMPGRFGRPP